MHESNLVKLILSTLRSRGAFAEKIHGGPMQAAGLPDIIAAFKGIFIGLEVKIPGREKTLTVRQSYTLEQIAKAGGISAMVTSVRQVDDILSSIEARSSHDGP